MGKVKFGVIVPEWMQEELDESLEYGDSRSSTVREAIELKFAVDDVLEGSQFEHLDGEEKISMVRLALRRKIED